MSTIFQTLRFHLHVPSMSYSLKMVQWIPMTLFTCDVKKIKDAAYRNGDIDATRKQGFRHVGLLNEVYSGDVDGTCSQWRI